MSRCKFVLRSAILDDTQQIIDYKKAGIFENGGEISAKERKRICDYVELRVPEQLKKYKLIVTEDKIVGCVLISRRENGSVSIDEIYIEKEYRNKKIGTSIIRNVLCEEPYVCLWVYKTNKKAWTLYKKLGFKIEKADGARFYMEAKRNYIFTCTSLGLFMIMFLIVWHWEKFEVLFWKYGIFFTALCFVVLGTMLWVIAKRWTSDYKISLGILIAGFLVFVFFPFAFVRTVYEYFIYKNVRNEVVELIKTGEMSADGKWDVTLYEEKYVKLSSTKKAHIYKKSESGHVVSFGMGTKMFAGSIELVYSSGGKDAIRENEGVNPILNIKKIDSTWFYVETKRSSDIYDQDRW